MIDEPIALRGVSLVRSLKKGFSDAYDNLAYVVLSTLGSSILVLAVLSLMLLARPLAEHLHAWAIVVLVLPALYVAFMCAVGVFYYVHKSVFHQHPVLTDTLAGVRRLFVCALWLFVVDLAISAVLMGDAAFFFGVFGARGGLVFTVLGVVCGYALLMWLMMLMYHLPLLVAQLDMESGPGVWVIIYKSYLLMVDNPGFTVGLFLVIIALAVLCALPIIGMALLYLCVAAFLLTHALRELFVKYEIIEDERELIEDNWGQKSNG